MSARRRVVVEFLDDAAFDSVDGLPDPHREVAWDLLEHLQENPFFGKPLGASIHTGDLTGTRSIYLIDFAERLIAHPPPHRIVYRLLPNESDPAVAQVIWAGPRHDLNVYRVAARRLR